MVTQERHIRSVEARLAHYRTHGAPRAGLCASAVREALNAPWQRLASATAVVEALPHGVLRKTHAPRGALVYWKGGQRNYGHVCFAAGDHYEYSVDVLPGRPGEVGLVPFDWFARHWDALTFVGWSWWFGRVDTRPFSVGGSLEARQPPTGESSGQ